MASSPLKGVSARFSPSTAPENILILPPTSVDIVASDAVRPRMRCMNWAGGAESGQGATKLDGAL
eukprot:scaffold230666_cov32-Tisochrysis_lutea.AAC.2